MASRLALLLSAALVVLPGSTPNPATAQQNAQRAVDSELPPISWACPMNGVVMAGVAPMSRMTYADAFPCGEAVRAEAIGHMPPWHAQEGAVRFRNAPTITAAQIDKILVWVSRGKAPRRHSAASRAAPRLAERQARYGAPVA